MEIQCMVIHRWYDDTTFCYSQCSAQTRKIIFFTWILWILWTHTIYSIEPYVSEVCSTFIDLLTGWMSSVQLFLGHVLGMVSTWCWRSDHSLHAYFIIAQYSSAILTYLVLHAVNMCAHWYRKIILFWSYRAMGLFLPYILWLRCFDC